MNNAIEVWPFGNAAVSIKETLGNTRTIQCRRAQVIDPVLGQGAAPVGLTNKIQSREAAVIACFQRETGQVYFHGMIAAAIGGKRALRH